MRLDDPLCEGTRANHLNLARDGGHVRGQRRLHRSDIHHEMLARVDEHFGGRAVARRQLEDHQEDEGVDEKHAARQDSPAAPERTRNLDKIDLGVVGLRIRKSLGLIQCSRLLGDSPQHKPLRVPQAKRSLAPAQHRPTGPRAARRETR